MSNRQMAHLLLSDYTFCQPSALEKLSEQTAGQRAAVHATCMPALAACLSAFNLPACPSQVCSGLPCMVSHPPTHCVLANRPARPPSPLTAAEALAAFWLGKGMAKKELVKLIVGFPKVGAIYPASTLTRRSQTVTCLQLVPLSVNNHGVPAHTHLPCIHSP